jgi:phenylpyruvate tautomerase PptA (4-oxalocrotonate tautomerase family)
MALTKEIHTEWLGYLHATQREDGSWDVTGITIPKQEVGSAMVTPKETVHSEGVIHSHVNMKAFFSGTDDAYLNENHQFSIVVNKSEEYAAVARMQLPCNAMSIVDTEMEIVGPNVDVDSFLTEAKKNLEEKTYPLLQSTRNTGNGQWNKRGNKWNWLPDSASQGDAWEVPDYDPKLKRNRHYSIHSQPNHLTAQEQKTLAECITQLNVQETSKKKRKELIRKVNEMSVTLKRDKVVVVRIELPDMAIENFVIDGQEVSPEGTVIGRYCKTCQAFSNISNQHEMFVYDKWTRLFECEKCGSFEVEPIISETHIATPPVADEHMNDKLTEK